MIYINPSSQRTKLSFKLLSFLGFREWLKSKLNKEETGNEENMHRILSSRLWRKAFLQGWSVPHELKWKTETGLFFHCGLGLTNKTCNTCTHAQASLLPSVASGRELEGAIIGWCVHELGFWPYWALWCSISSNFFPPSSWWFNTTYSVACFP